MSRFERDGPSLALITDCRPAPCGRREQPVQQSDPHSPIADNSMSNAAPGQNSTNGQKYETDHDHQTDHEMIGFDRLALGSERLGGMVVRSAQVRKVLKTISLLSPYKATVLISGESGTGKELVARALHTLGPVPGGPFVTFNCSNLVESLAESQLFGHLRGAFTDRARNRKATSAPPMGARCFSTRSRNCHSSCNRSCCVRSRPMRCSQSVRRIATRWIYGWWRRPIATCARWLKLASSATISTTG